MSDGGEPPLIDRSEGSGSDGRVGKSFLALASGDALARAIAFVAGVYVGRTLGESMFGVVTFCTGVLLYFSNIAECGIDLLGVRHIAEDKRRIGTVAGALLGARLIVALVLAAAVWFLSPIVLPEPEGRVFQVYGLGLVFIGLGTRWIHLGLQQSKPVAIARTLGEVVYLVSVLLFVHSNEHIRRVPLAQIAGDALASLVLFMWLRRGGFRFRLEFDAEKVRPILSRSWPLVANVLLGLTIYNADLIFLRWWYDSGTVGWYSAAYQLVSFLINMAAAYSLSLLPALTKVMFDRVRRDELYRNAVAQTFAVALPIAVGGALLAPQIVAAVFGPQFQPSGPVLAIVICTIPFTVSKEIDLIALVVSGRERTVMRMTALAVCVNLVLNVLLIPRYGMHGAAWSTLITEAVRAGFARWCAATEHYPWTGLARRWKSLLAGAAMAAALWLVHLSLPFAIALGALVYLAVLFATGGIRLARGSLPALRV